MFPASLCRPAPPRPQLLSFTSDVPISGVSFSATADADADPADESPDATDSKPPRTSSPRKAFLHVVDRYRTLRTWLLRPEGAIAVVAYSLPPPSPPPRVPSDGSARAANENPRVPETTNRTPPDDGGVRDRPAGAIPGTQGVGTDGGDTVVRDPLLREERSFAAAGDENRGGRGNHPGGGAPFGAVVGGSLCRGSRPTFVVIAGVALTGVTFLPTSDVSLTGGAHEPLWGASPPPETVGAGGPLDDQGPRLFGMQAVVFGGGSSQALALLWAERPRFEVLDAGSGGRPAAAQHVSLGRTHRRVDSRGVGLALLGLRVQVAVGTAGSGVEPQEQTRVLRSQEMPAE